MSFDQRKLVRQEQSVPILDSLGKWMKEEYTEAKGITEKSYWHGHGL